MNEILKNVMHILHFKISGINKGSFKGEHNVGSRCFGAKIKMCCLLNCHRSTLISYVAGL